MERWKFTNTIADNGLKHLINAEITADGFTELREKSAQLSKLIMEAEEKIVISGLSTQALQELSIMIEKELDARDVPPTMRPQKSDLSDGNYGGDVRI
jgi:hypothetical protein